MAFQVFIALLFLTAALGFYFAPRNRHVGFRTKHTFLNEDVWKKTNRFASVLFALAGAALLYFSNCGYSNDDFYFFVLIGIFAVAFLSLRYAVKLAGEITPIQPAAGQEKKKVKKVKKSKNTVFFSQSRKMSVFFSLLCLALIGVSYVWLVQCLAFMPDDMAIYNHIGERVALGMSFESYSLGVRLAFFTILILCAIAYIAAANYYKKGKGAVYDYSLKVALSDIFLAYAASLALLLSAANYAFYRSSATSRVGADEFFSMAVPLLGIVIVWFALFKINARLLKKQN